ncbi:hypothetical protein GCM10011375_23470 [Hymenobacter qilianensis]|uniref:Uncharacterized protein n=2 Tax=Hymenobacter qilianensis TaxID=1385715 RepID=A0ACB5PSK3_9BACT|nr:hypothetical protein [Hymenobacter qilianensis]QNP52446.1 hypothetical protein H9L05_01250 [Hymenobacter qilianensis]GGF67751.1 hypothetical protein GCM10011375_23470 [Hymenobacter qilianensis]
MPYILHLSRRILQVRYRIFAPVKRPLTHRIFSGLLALLILAASVGLTVQRRTCNVSGRSTANITFRAAVDACQPSNNVLDCGASVASQLRQACCDLATDFHKLSAPAPASLGGKFLAGPAISPWPATTVWPPIPASPLLAQAACRWYASDASPPSRAGRVLLAFGCILVV